MNNEESWARMNEEELWQEEQAKNTRPREVRVNIKWKNILKKAHEQNDSKCKSNLG